MVRKGVDNVRRKVMSEPNRREKEKNGQERGTMCAQRCDRV